jgi:hypothetical protein
MPEQNRKQLLIDLESCRVVEQSAQGDLTQARLELDRAQKAFDKARAHTERIMYALMTTLDGAQ